MLLDEREQKNILNSNIIQNLVLENREKLIVTGVNDVISFDDEIVVIDTDLGLLNIKGENLHINKLSIDTAEVIVEGEIYNLSYSNKKGDKPKESIIGKIFK